MFQKLWSDDIRFLRYGAWRMQLIFILGYFLPYYPPNSPKNQNFEKIKKPSGDIIILHMCTKNYDQMIYASWDIVRDRCNCYFSFWAIFCPFTPPTAQKIMILNKWKKMPGDIIILHKCTKLWSDDVRFLRYVARRTKRRTDGPKKWHLEVGAPPKNQNLNQIAGSMNKCNVTFKLTVWVSFNVSHLFLLN